MNDHEDIRRTLAAFCQFLDGRRFEEWAALFTEDGIFNAGVGRAAVLAEMQRGTLATNPSLDRLHLSANSIIDVEGDEARVVSDVIFFERRDQGPWSIGGVGKYVDRLVRAEGAWRFAERRWENLATPEASLGTTAQV